MDEPLPARHLGVTIQRSAEAVYDFLAEPRHFAQWASGMGDSLRQVDGRWCCDGPQGLVRLRFTPRNAFGVADHWVELAPGQEIAIPMRVLANGDAAEVVFTLFRQPDMDDARFAADAEWVMRDLATLKQVLESR